MFSGQGGLGDESQMVMDVECVFLVETGEAIV